MFTILSEKQATKLKKYGFVLKGKSESCEIWESENDSSIIDIIRADGVTRCYMYRYEEPSIKHEFSPLRIDWFFTKKCILN